jgi:ferredoxin--NADP+ reductase
VVEKIASDIEDGSIRTGDKHGRPGFDRLAETRGLEVVTFRDWKKIEEAEEARARSGAPREKFVDIAEMIRARDT